MVGCLKEIDDGWER